MCIMDELVRSARQSRSVFLCAVGLCAGQPLQRRALRCPAGRSQPLRPVLWPRCVPGARCGCGAAPSIPWLPFFFLFVKGLLLAVAGLSLLSY